MYKVGRSERMKNSIVNAENTRQVGNSLLIQFWFCNHNFKNETSGWHAKQNFVVIECKKKRFLYKNCKNCQVFSESNKSIGMQKQLRQWKCLIKRLLLLSFLAYSKTWGHDQHGYMYM